MLLLRRSNWNAEFLFVRCESLGLPLIEQGFEGFMWSSFNQIMNLENICEASIIAHVPMDTYEYLKKYFINF